VLNWSDEVAGLIEIDGGFGEGGGQILRSALSLSCLTETPFRIINIRRSRSKPGLQPQHLMAVKALKSVCRADVEGGTIGSKYLAFRPGKAVPGEYVFDIGTAGSTTLLLQALLPPLIFADGSSSLRLIGGTHVPMSPIFDYLQSVFSPFLRSIGIDITVSIQKYGFYPQGGGRMGATIVPVKKGDGLCPTQLLNASAQKSVHGVSAVGNLPLSIAERQRSAALDVLSANGIEAQVEAKSVTSPSPGTYIFFKSTGGCGAGFSSIGQRGKRAEVVGSEAARELLSYIRTEACLDYHLADQVLIYLSLAAGQSTYSTSMITEHLATNLAVIQRFLPVSFEMKGQKGHPGTIIVNGIGYRR
jgi:RNA 3'-terminal phosphate cyclase (ATP)